MFWLCLENGKFPLAWRKANVFPVLKKNKQEKNNKQQLMNYLPISLLPVLGKIFKRLLYDSMALNQVTLGLTSSKCSKCSH